MSNVSDDVNVNDNGIIYLHMYLAFYKLPLFLTAPRQIPYIFLYMYTIYIIIYFILYMDQYWPIKIIIKIIIIILA